MLSLQLSAFSHVSTLYPKLSSFFFHAYQVRCHVHDLDVAMDTAFQGLPQGSSDHIVIQEKASGGILIFAHKLPLHHTCTSPAYLVHP